MKILLDENIPVKVRTDFGKEYEVKSVRDMGWLGKKNGELLGLIAFNGFDFFVTLDKIISSDPLFSSDGKFLRIFFPMFQNLRVKIGTIRPLNGFYFRVNRHLIK